MLQALWASGRPHVGNVGCLGQGSCGSCRMFLRDGDRVLPALACETLIRDGLDVQFLQPLDGFSPHRYRLEELRDPDGTPAGLRRVFPEAARCRHCGGCDAACPRSLPVESGVGAMVAGRLTEVLGTYDACIMCDLCADTCPEGISPNHLLLAARRLLATDLQPANLMRRLHEVESGAMRIVLPQPEAPHD